MCKWECSLKRYQRWTACFSSWYTKRYRIGTVGCTIRCCRKGRKSKQQRSPGSNKSRKLRQRRSGPSKCVMTSAGLSARPTSGRSSITRRSRLSFSPKTTWTSTLNIWSTSSIWWSSRKLLDSRRNRNVKLSIFWFSPLRAITLTQSTSSSIRASLTSSLTRLARRDLSI